MSNGRAAVVVGASGGIGLAITRQLMQRQSFERVYATCRQPAEAKDLFDTDDGRLSVLKVDITCETELHDLAKHISGNGHHLELVINCAGILHEAKVQPEKALSQCRQDSLMRLFLVNSTGPLLLAKALIPLMPRNRPGHFVVLSAMVGSIGDNRLGGWYGYRASKAALNQLMRTLAIECRRSHPQLCITSIHPGTTDTSLSRPFQTNVTPGKLYTPDQTAARILQVMGAGQAEQSGRFVSWDGEVLPW